MTRSGVGELLEAAVPERVGEYISSPEYGEGFAWGCEGVGERPSCWEHIYGAGGFGEL